MLLHPAVVVPAIVGLQILRRIVKTVIAAATAHKMDMVARVVEQRRFDTDNKRALRNVIDRYLDENGAALFAAWQSKVSAPSAEATAAYAQCQADAVARLRDVIHRTTDLESDKASLMPFLAHRDEGYFATLCRHRFIDLVRTPVEFEALFMDIYQDNKFHPVRTLTSLTGARYVVFGVTAGTTKVVDSFVLRTELRETPIGVLSVVEARLLYEIFLKDPIHIMTNSAPTPLAQRVAHVLKVPFIGRDHLRALSVPMW